MKYLLLIACILLTSGYSALAQTAKGEAITTDCTLADVSKDLSGTWDINYKGTNGTMSIIVSADNVSLTGAFAYPDRKGGSVKGSITGSIETGKDSKLNCSYILDISWTDGSAVVKQGKLTQVRGSKTIAGSIGSTSIMASKKL